MSQSLSSQSVRQTWWGKIGSKGKHKDAMLSAQRQQYKRHIRKDKCKVQERGKCNMLQDMRARYEAGTG